MIAYIERKEMAALTGLKLFVKDTGGDAVVEAAILFPIMIMIFAALVLLATYLPQRMLLQEAAQYAATAVATQAGDTYVAFDDNGNRIRKTPDISVYVTAFKGIFGGGISRDHAGQIATHRAENAIMPVSSRIDVDVKVTNFVVYREITVTLTQTVPMPVDLSFIGFPKELRLEQQASAVVQDGDEFVRNIDIAKDMMVWLDSKLGISQSLRESGALGKIEEVYRFFGFGG